MLRCHSILLPDPFLLLPGKLTFVSGRVRRCQAVQLGGYAVGNGPGHSLRHLPVRHDLTPTCGMTDVTSDVTEMTVK